MARKYRMYPEAVALSVLSIHCEQSRFVWNLALEQWNEWHPGRRSHAPNYVLQAAQLTEAREASQWLAAGSTVVQQGALRDFDQAKRNFYARSHRRPRWRSAKAGRQGFLIRDAKVRPDPNPRYAQTLVPKAGWVRFRLSRAVPTTLTSARVTLDAAGYWHIAFTASAETTVDLGRPKAPVVGVDRGVVVPAALSDGRLLCKDFHHPPVGPDAAVKKARRERKLVREQRRRLRLQQQLARQKAARRAEGRTGPSHRETRTKLALNRIMAREAHRRRDWVEQTSHLLVQSAHLVALERLDVKAMTRTARGTIAHPGTNVRAKAGLNRGILASGWGQLAARTRTKAEQSTWCRYVEVPAYYTSLTCPACGYVDIGNRESQAVFCCRECGHAQHADVVGAVNVRQRGIELAAAAGSAVAARRDLKSGSRKREPDPRARTTAPAA
ncbi:MAG: transposase [Nakamurella sp.]